PVFSRPSALVKGATALTQSLSSALSIDDRSYFVPSYEPKGGLSSSVLGVDGERWRPVRPQRNSDYEPSHYRPLPMPVPDPQPDPYPIPDPQPMPYPRPQPEPVFPMVLPTLPIPTS